MSREDVDRYALDARSSAPPRRSEPACFDRSVIAVDDAIGLPVLEQDEFIKPRTTLEGLGQLKVAFAELGAMGFDAVALARYPQVERIEHVHTAGNSSGIVDGAAAVLIGSEAMGRALGLVPRARIVATALSGADPTIMLTGPMPATRKALAKAGLDVDDIDLFEVNEAFAAVPMRFMREMGVPHEKVNVNGGAIAMGHPLGATGAMLLGTLLDELERRNLQARAGRRCASAAAWASRRSSSASEMSRPCRPRDSDDARLHWHERHEHCATSSRRRHRHHHVRRARRAGQHDDAGVAARPGRGGGAGGRATRSGSAA